jgi:hypothetical protein
MQDIGDMLTDEAFAKFKKGQTLTFAKDGKKREFKIVSIQPEARRCIVRPIKLLTVEEFEAEVQ